MEKKMIKIVAGFVLGAFSLGCAAPAFAAVNENDKNNLNSVSSIDYEKTILGLSENSDIVSTSIEYQINQDTQEYEKVFIFEVVTVTEDGNRNPSVERSIKKVALKTLKKIIEDNWTKLPIDEKWDKVKDKLFEALDYYFEISDSIEEVLTNSFTDAFPDAPSWVITAIVEVIMKLLPV